MSEIKTVNTARRSFFLKGGAMLGAGLASGTAGASTLAFDNTLPLKEQLAQLHQQLDSLENKEAIRHLHLAFSTLMTNHAYAAVTELFADQAHVALHGETFIGKHQGIRHLFMEQYARQLAPVLHTTLLQDQSQQNDTVSISNDQQTASARFHCRVQVSKPLTGHSVVAEMARLQGLTAETSWEAGLYEVEYVRVEGRWKIDSLRYRQV